MIPLTRATRLTGVAQAAAATRDAIDIVLRQRSVQVQAASLAARSAARGARSSAELEDGDPDEQDDPLVQGALRATGAVGELAPLWERAPLQVLARLHVLAAADLADADALGRPRDRTSARRLTGVVAEIGRAARPGSAVPALVVAAMVHAEAAEAFAPAGGLVGRAAERVVLVSSGVDPAGVLVPEHGHLVASDGYARDRARLLTGTDVAVATWVERCCRAYAAAAEATAALLAE